MGNRFWPVAMAMHDRAKSLQDARQANEESQMLIRSIRRQCVQAREHEAIVESRAEHEIKVIQTKLRSHIVTLEEKQFTVDETINAEKHCQQRLRDTIAQNVKKCNLRFLKRRVDMRGTKPQSEISHDDTQTALIAQYEHASLVNKHLERALFQSEERCWVLEEASEQIQTELQHKRQQLRADTTALNRNPKPLRGPVRQRTKQPGQKSADISSQASQDPQEDTVFYSAKHADPLDNFWPTQKAQLGDQQFESGLVAIARWVDMCQAASVRLRRGIKSLIASAFVKLGEFEAAVMKSWRIVVHRLKTRIADLRKEYQITVDQMNQMADTLQMVEAEQNENERRKQMCDQRRLDRERRPLQFYDTAQDALLAERTNLDVIDRKLAKSMMQLNDQLNTQEENRLQLINQITLKETTLAVELRAKQMGELEGITYAVTNAIAPNEQTQDGRNNKNLMWSSESVLSKTAQFSPAMSRSRGY